MADLNAQIDKFDELIEYIRTELPKYAQQVAALDLTALVTRRVISTGKNYLGAPFKPYSSNTVPAYRFWGKSRTQKAENKIRALAKAKSSLSYSDFRKLNSLPAENKTFEFTGEMWRKLGVVSTKIGNDKYLISVGGTTTAAQEKIDDNTEREGVSIIEASAAEAKLVEQALLEWIEQQAERILNS